MTGALDRCPRFRMEVEFGKEHLFVSPAVTKRLAGWTCLVGSLHCHSRRSYGKGNTFGANHLFSGEKYNLILQKDFLI